MQQTDEGVKQHAEMLKALADIATKIPEANDIFEKSDFANDVKDWTKDLQAFYAPPGTKSLVGDQSNDNKIRALTEERKKFRRQ